MERGEEAGADVGVRVVDYGMDGLSGLYWGLEGRRGSRGDGFIRYGHEE